MKALVIYRSKTGNSKVYAKWIARQIGGDLREYKTVSPSIFVAYDTIIYGAGLYASGINGIRLITDNLQALKDKQVIVFATGATPERPETTEWIRNRHFTPEQQRLVQFFYLRGGFDFRKLHPADKMLMTLLRWRLMLKQDKSPDDRGMLAAFSHPLDFTQQQNLAPLLLSLRQ